MATFNKFQDFSEQLVDGYQNFATDAYKIALSNSAPTATNTALGDITQISAGNGYTSGVRLQPSQRLRLRHDHGERHSGGVYSVGRLHRPVPLRCAVQRHDEYAGQQAVGGMVGLWFLDHVG